MNKDKNKKFHINFKGKLRGDEFVVFVRDMPSTEYIVENEEALSDYNL